MAKKSKLKKDLEKYVSALTKKINAETDKNKKHRMKIIRDEFDNLADKL